MATGLGDKFASSHGDDDPDEVRSKYPVPVYTNREPETDDIRFSPPLYKQRYALAMEYVKKMCPRKVVDFGCAECKFMWAIRNQNYEFVREIIGVDIDKIVLESNDCVAKPVTSEYLFRRSTPLRIGLYCGSLTEWDARLEGVEFVSLIEVIEHLEYDILTQLPSAIFGTLKPKCVFITTPNCEFNILFKDFSGFRHPDHKFEWNREEFVKWCEDICHNFPYQVELSGAGEPPMGCEEVGYCSQAAIFTAQYEIDRKLADKHLQDNNNNNKFMHWEDCGVDGQTVSPIDPTPRESIFSDLNLKTNQVNNETNNPNGQPSSNTEAYVYKEIICNDFPLKDPNDTPERQLLIDLQYHAMQIARNEWKTLEGQGVREEDIEKTIYESNGTYFEPGNLVGYLLCFVSIPDRLMSYPQIKFFGSYEEILKIVVAHESAKLNVTQTHYRVDMVTEDHGSSDDEANFDENENDDVDEEHSNWGTCFQGVVPESNFVSVPENWDDEPWDT